MQEYTTQKMIAILATRPIVRPTAPPKLRPPPLFLCTPVRLCALGRTVGVVVTVLTWPVTVSRNVTGVGIRIVDNEEDDFDIVAGVPKVTADVVLGVMEVCLRYTSKWNSIKKHITFVTSK